MSANSKRTLNDLTNESKRAKHDSNFDIGELKQHSTSSLADLLLSPVESFVEDDDVFADEPSSASKLSQNYSRKRLNGTSTSRTKTKRSKRKDARLLDQALLDLREEQARVDAHALSILQQAP